MVVDVGHGAAFLHPDSFESGGRVGVVHQLVTRIDLENAPRLDHGDAVAEAQPSIS